MMFETKVGRLSWPAVFAPYTYDDGSRKYKTTFLIAKGDEGFDKIRTEVEGAIEDAVTREVWGKRKPKDLKMPWLDGDEIDDADDDDPRRGHWVVSTSSTKRPAIVDAAGDQLLDEDAIYGGVYARLMLLPYAYNKGNKGITLILLGVQKIRDGEPLGGGSRALTFSPWEAEELDEFL